jgi:hypothetical protein
MVTKQGVYLVLNSDKAVPFEKVSVVVTFAGPAVCPNPSRWHTTTPVRRPP